MLICEWKSLFMVTLILQSIYYIVEVIHNDLVLKDDLKCISFKRKRGYSNGPTVEVMKVYQIYQILIYSILYGNECPIGPINIAQRALFVQI